MSARLPADPQVFLEALAAKMGITFEQLHRATSRRSIWHTPGKLVEDEDPLPIGSLMNLRRHPPTYTHASEKGWAVTGYTRNSGGRWIGYVLVRGAFSVENTTISKAEAFDLVERYEVLPT